MLHTYRTLGQSGAKEIVIRKSRFIGHGSPVHSEEEASRFIQRIRSEHGTATHHCYAYLIGDHDQIQKQSDDGEPSGTAGRPILDVLKNGRIQNAVIVVTRYFGGIMLGAGGLIRAYSQGAVAAIEASQLVVNTLHREVRVNIDYTWLGSVQHALRQRGTRLGESEFSDKVVLICYPTVEEYEAFADWMTDLTEGQASLTQGDTHCFASPV